MGEPAPGTQARWSDLGRRAASAAVLAPVAVACIWFGGLAFDALLLAAALGLVIEWAGLSGVQLRAFDGSMLLLTVLLAWLAAAAQASGVGILLLLVGAGAIWAVARRPMPAAGALYVGLPLVALIWLRTGAGGRDVVLFLVLVIWASDIGAYLAGRLLRGPKLAPVLSPSKTWSGALGGLAAAMLIGQLVPAGGPALAALLAAVGQAGDLLESAIKRHVGVKDSGRLIPGHGGLFDRLDGLLAAAPVAALLVLISRGGTW